MVDPRAIGPRRRALPALTGARFVAAFLVPLYHDVRLEHGPAWVNHVFENGHLAVPFFFALSGFILAYNYLGSAREGALRSRSFLGARIARIYPVYLVGLLAFLPFGVVDARRHAGASMLRAVHLVAVQLGFSATMTQAWVLVKPLAMGLNTPGWSLSVEFALYLLFPLLAPPIARCRRLWIWGLLVLSFAADEIIFLATNGLPVQGRVLGVTGELMFANHPLFHLPTFVMGICVARLLEERLRDCTTDSRAAAIASLALTAVLLFAVTSSDLGAAHPHATAHLDVVFAAAVAALSLGSGPIARILARPRMVLLGEASYSLYILHQPFWAYFQQGYCNVLHLGTSGTVPFDIVYLVGAVTVSLVSYRFIETPARRWIQGRLSVRAATTEREPSLTAEPM